MNLFAAIGFTLTMLFLVVLLHAKEWLARFRWWMLPEAEKQRRIAEQLSLVCRPSFIARHARDLYK